MIAAATRLPQLASGWPTQAASLRAAAIGCCQPLGGTGPP